MTLVGALMTVALTGCGGGSHSTSSTPQVVSTAPASAYAHTGLAARVLTSSELPSGFSGGPPTVTDGPRAWAAAVDTPPNLEASQTARYRREGFVAGATEDLSGPSGAAGLSLVEQFRSAAGALAEFAHDVSSFNTEGGGPVLTFSVPGIPRALGFGGGTASSGGANVSFVDGDYYYLVGEGLAPTVAVRTALIASAQKLYYRITG